MAFRIDELTELGSLRSIAASLNRIAVSLERLIPAQQPVRLPERGESEMEQAAADTAGAK